MKLMNRRKSGGNYGRPIVRSPKGQPVINHFVRNKNNNIENYIPDEAQFICITEMLDQIKEPEIDNSFRNKREYMREKQLYCSPKASPFSLLKRTRRC